MNMKRYKDDLAGMTFGRWKVIEKDKTPGRTHCWLCVCVCGKTSSVTHSWLHLGRSLSCGCLQSDWLKKKNTTHGMTGTRLHRIYTGIVDRCDHPHSKHYTNYGARGIKNLWGSFEEFITDMQSSHDAHFKVFGGMNTSLERIDNNGHYCKDNCRWATKQEQSENRRTNRIIEHNGEKLLLRDWAKKLNMNMSTLKYRLSLAGWSFEKASTEPVKVVNFKKKAMDVLVKAGKIKNGQIVV